VDTLVEQQSSEGDAARRKQLLRAIERKPAHNMLGMISPLCRPIAGKLVGDHDAYSHTAWLMTSLGNR
jgi:hypothetical protein